MKTKRIVWYLGIVLIVFLVFAMTVGEYYGWASIRISGELPKTVVIKNSDKELSSFFISNKTWIKSIGKWLIQLAYITPVVFSLVFVYGILAKISLPEYLISSVAILGARIFTYFLLRDFNPENFIFKDHLILIGKYLGAYVLIRIIYEIYLKSRKTKIAEIKN